MARLLALGLCAAGALAGKGKKYEDHTMDALAWLKENTPSTLIVDVRTKAEYETVSARMKPFSKSVWITPAACGAFVPLRIVQARVSLGPAVK